MSESLIDLMRDGMHVSEPAIFEPCWLYAGRLTNLDTLPAKLVGSGRATARTTGASWRFVYRSVLVRAGSDKHQRLMEWLDGAIPIGDAQFYEDPDMMFGTGELTLWEA